MTLQRDHNNTSRCLSICMHIVATPGLLKITLDLGFRIYHRDNLGMDLHQFGIGQNTSAARKVLKACDNQHQVITGGGAAPSQANVAMMMAPDGVSLQATLSMERGAHARLRVLLVTLFGPEHPTTLAIRDVNKEIMERETDMEEYNPRDWDLNVQLPESITCWVQIQLYDWFSRQC